MQPRESREGNRRRSLTSLPKSAADAFSSGSDDGELEATLEQAELQQRKQSVLDFIPGTTLN